METKKCACCGRELPLDKFGKSSRYADGYDCYCRECRVEKSRQSRKRKKVMTDGTESIVDKPDIDPGIEKKLDEAGLDKIEPYLLISELRRRGYRGKLTLVIKKEVVI